MPFTAIKNKATNGEIVIDISSDESFDDGLYSKQDNLKIGPFCIDIKDLTILKNVGSWFNDEIINAYFYILSQRHNQHQFLSSFFYSKLKVGGLNGVKKWYSYAEIFTKKYIFIPINIKNAHWVLVKIDIVNRKCFVYDSLNSGKRSGKMTSSRIIEDIIVYLDFIEKDHVNESSVSDAVGLVAFLLARTNINRPEKTFAILIPGNVPRQVDGGSCGAFICKFAKMLANDEVLTFCQGDVDLFRIEMMQDFENYSP